MENSIQLYVVVFEIIFFNSVALSRNLEVYLSFLPSPHLHYDLTISCFTNYLLKISDMIESDNFITFIMWRLK